VALVLPGLGLTMTGCSPSSSEALMLDTSPAGSARGAALTADSELHGEVVDGRACFWVVTDNGAEVTLVWPPGSVAREDPLRIENSAGQVVATAGASARSMSGNPDQSSGCRPGSTRFIVGSID